MKQKRFAIVEHFSGSIYTLADFKKLIVLDPYSDEWKQYSNKKTMLESWNIVEWQQTN